jgi:hypothetical protein
MKTRRPLILDNVTYHDIGYDGSLDDLSELQCFGPRPGAGPALDGVEIFVKNKELMARHNNEIFEINLCEGCYESIICKLLEKTL